jgi:class 3 adenylate cyclase/DNA-binding response OmpR family regulator
MEDSDIFADMLIEFLSPSGYTLERAVNGFEGIKKVYSFLPHLIITDIEMPILRGYQVTRLLKSRKNTMNIPVIIFSTLNETRDKFWGSQAGADLFFEKKAENLQLLGEAAAKILSNEALNIDFAAIKRESKKINDNAIIEIVNNLLDNKLFQTTVIGLLADISGRAYSMEKTVYGIFDLLHTICEAEIVTMMIRGSKRDLYIYSANFAGFTAETSDNFLKICMSDFNKHFPGYKADSKQTEDFLGAGTNKKNIISYISVPLVTRGENFASVHIANSINEYFTPSIMENINVFLGASSAVIANTLSLFELTELQKNTRTAFARYVPADVMDEIINETQKQVIMSENRKVSVLFSDIRDFTTISENYGAQAVVDILNAYFTKMGNEIITEGGHIDKFIGDAIMAVFGAFGNMENPCENAIRTAVKMLKTLEEMNEGGTLLSGNKIQTGIGINYGECILGNIGFQNKMDYTIIGDTVNLASRIESLTKLYHHPLIVSEYVYEMTKDKFLYRKADNVRVKGKEKTVGIYAVYSGFHGEQEGRLRSGESTGLPAVSGLLINRETLVNYNKGLNTFYMHEWKLAQEYFIKSLETDNGDFLSQLYLERSLEFMRNPPPEEWDGVFTLAGIRIERRNR